MRKLAMYALFSVAVMVWAKDKKQDPPKNYSCVAGPGEQCASDLWIADYQKLKAFQEKYKAPQDIVDQMNGLAMRLNQSIPPGFMWDEAKQRFVKKPEPPKPVSAEPEKPKTAPEPAKPTPEDEKK